MIKIIKDLTTTWAVRIVRPGERYGRYVNKTSTLELVEFYDTRFEWGPLGAFVAAFERKVIQSRTTDDGMVLDARSLSVSSAEEKPEWYVSKEAIKRIQQWLGTQP